MFKPAPLFCRFPKEWFDGCRACGVDHSLLSVCFFSVHIYMFWEDIKRGMTVTNKRTDKFKTIWTNSTARHTLVRLKLHIRRCHLNYGLKENDLQLRISCLMTWWWLRVFWQQWHFNDTILRTRVILNCIIFRATHYYRFTNFFVFFSTPQPPPR